MAIYNAYLEGAEREAAIFNMELDNQYDKLSLLYEISCMELEQAKKDIELKVFRENGTYDDLEYLISEAEAQAAQDQGNVLTRVFEWFRGILNGIITGIKNLFTGTKVDPKTEVEIIDDPNEATQNNIFNSIMSTINGANDENTILGLPKALAGVIGAVAAGATVGGIFMLNRAAKKKKATAGEVNAQANSCSENATKMLDIIGKLENFSNQFKNLPVIGRITEAINRVCGDYLRPIAEFFKAKGDYLKEVIQGAATFVKNTITGNKDATNQTANQTATQTNGPASVTSATPDKNNTRIKVVYNDSTSGTPVQKTAYVNTSGKVMGGKDKDGVSIPAAVKNAIETSPVVKEGLNKIANAISNKAMQNSPQAQLATGNQVETQNQKNAKEAAAKQKAEKEKAKAQQKAAKAAENHPNNQFINNEAANLQMELGDDYTVEVADDGVIEITLNTVIECADDFMSTTQSIFGMIAEEEALEDPELVELQNLFNEL